MKKSDLTVPAREAIANFVLYGEMIGIGPFGGGHINDTFVSVWDQGGTRIRYLHQRINEKVFTRPEEVMENIDRVTKHITRKLIAGGEPSWSRRTLSVIPAKDGRPWVRDSEGGWWRTYLFIEETHTLELANSPGDGRVLGASIGRFQKQLADLPPPRLHETIPDFHNMEKRYERFYRAVSQDTYKKAKEVQEEISFMAENEERGRVLIGSLKAGTIPERICHNDTKMNNILIDNSNNAALCVGDLDTVMPGASLFDTGDLIRTVTTRAEEDERDLSKVIFDLAFFESLLDGYLSEASTFLTVEEKKLLTESGRNITQIMGLRFLTDYLEGNHYYRISRESHNIDRCRNQIALIRSMDKHWNEAEATVERLCGLYR
jgi:thiamine kinase-like enzyme